MPANVDAESLVRLASAHVGAPLSVLGVAAHGDTGGAVFVAWPDGRRSVLTPSEVPLEELRRTASVLELARARGLPVPRYEAVVGLECGGGIVVQERLPGEVRPMTVQRLEAMVGVCERFAGVLAERADVPVPRLLLRHERGPGLLGTYDDRTRALLRCVRAFGERDLRGDDLVHADFNHENVLFDERDAVSGVVDWNGSFCRGDRRFGLVKLRYLAAWSKAEPAVLSRLDSILEELLDPETLLVYWAHWGLRMVDWTILNGWPAATTLHLDIADERLGFR